MADPYLYDDVPVLRNALSIKDEKTLDLIEAEQSHANMMIVYEQGFHDFLPEGLQSIHRFLFGDLYDWAGKFRIINMEKRERLLRAAACGTATMQRSRNITHRSRIAGVKIAAVKQLTPFINKEPTEGPQLALSVIVLPHGFYSLVFLLVRSVFAMSFPSALEERPTAALIPAGYPTLLMLHSSPGDPPHGW